MNTVRSNLKAFLNRVSWPDILAVVVVACGAVLYLLDLSSGLYSFVKFLALLAAIYLVARALSWWSTRLLWSLRNRLIVAYLFVALVPVVFVTVLAVQGAMILYTQLGGYLLYEDFQKRIELVADGTEQVASALRLRGGGISQAEAESIVSRQEHQVLDARLPGLQISFSNDPGTLEKIAGENNDQYAGLLQQGDQLEQAGMEAV